MSLQLVIGNKNYSSWSLRPWMLLDHFEVPFREILIELFSDNYRDELARYSPNLKVPVLIDEELTVWESLAICEYINEQYLDNRALPAGREARALCRSFCSEMHAGFMALRSELPMNCRARKQLSFSAAVEQDIRRVDALWTQARRRFVDRGDYLFGKFSLADCMYAPVVMRFYSYGAELGPEAGDYFQFMLEEPSLKRWRQAAAAEERVLSDFEVGEPR
jgi:glutathione S-transferase